MRHRNSDALQDEQNIFFKNTTRKKTSIARDGKSVINSTGEYFSLKKSTKNAYFATYCTLRQNSVNFPELAQFILEQ